ncbi:MAG: type II toxin-antitoxin system HicA family toxin [Nitrososphaerota archaeon]|nr:type II toxin-antitoxin system HicA family toxin [Nitrososphaerota archaeon]MDG7027821.1 type II toxin-antitoxin system HicA family toxin [Nitrososphaerota archaeon]
MGWRDVLKALARRGFKPVRQRGSHIIVEDSIGHFATVPRRDEIKRGTLLSIIEEAGMTREEFLELVS